MSISGYIPERVFPYGMFTDILMRKSEDSGVAVIPDIKCKSPAEGDLIPETDAAGLAAEFEGRRACDIRGHGERPF